MNTQVSIADLERRHKVSLTADEAVAVVQQLIHDADAEHAEPPFGPPTPENIELGGDGSVICRSCAVTPAVPEVAILLQAILPTGAGAVPGGLRYAIARALHDVDAPPFDSLADFARTLARYERGDRRVVIRNVVDRSAAAAGSIERRRLGASATELRRYLREVDRQLYEQRQRQTAGGRLIVPPQWAPRTPSRVPAAIAASVAIALSFLAGRELIRYRQSDLPAPRIATQLPQHSTPRDASAAVGPVAPSAAGIPPRPAVVNPPPVASRAALESPPNRRASSQSGSASADDKEDHTAAEAQTSDTLVPALDQTHRPMFSPAFASNGTAIFFHTGRSGDANSALMSVDLKSPDLRVISIVDDGARNYHVQPSPDGRLIAFDSDRDGERGVYVADSDGANVRRVSGPGYAAVPTWAPDGQRLAFIRAEPDNAKVWNLWLLAIGTSDVRRLTHYAYGETWGASWFPGGDRLCYTHEDKIVLLDLPTGRTRQFESPIAGRLVRTPAVSPDGTKVIFQVYRNGAWLLDLADGSMRCVLTDPSAEEFAWAPDGRRVAFHSRRDGQWGIWLMREQ